MTVANSHHPKVFDASKIIVDNKGILIGFLLTRDETLSGFYGIVQNWTLDVCIIKLSNFDLRLVLANMT